MEYEWEEKATAAIAPKIEAVNGKLPYGFAIMGVAIENEDTGEAFYMPVFEDDKSVLMSDLLKDVLGDVDRLYHETIENRRLS
jgi:hypothetical protein